MALCELEEQGLCGGGRPRSIKVEAVLVGQATNSARTAGARDPSTHELIGLQEAVEGTIAERAYARTNEYGLKRRRLNLSPPERAALQSDRGGRYTPGNAYELELLYDLGPSLIKVVPVMEYLTHT